MNIAVMGTGAIGGYVGARLAAEGASVTFIARGRHLAAIREGGLKVLSPLGNVHIDPARATDDPAAVGEVDVVLLGTKLYDVEFAARAIAPMVGGDSVVICLQNGIDAIEIVAHLYGAAHVLGGVVMINGEIMAPGVIRHNALNHLAIGELDGRNTRRLEGFVALANAAGIETTASPTIRVEIWRKFLLAAPMAALSAITRVPLASIRQHADTLQLTVQGMREVVAVAKAQGIGLTEDDVQRTLMFVKSMPPTWKASLATDLEHGRRLEVDWLAGAVCRLGRASGIETPFHSIANAVLQPHAAGRG